MAAPSREPLRPTFLCVGAGKSGTTWLWEVLRHHPDVFLPAVKEVHYFNAVAYDGNDVRNPNADKSLRWYLDHFADARPHQVCGEISPSYLWDEAAPARIHAFDSDMRIIILLRDPVARLFSGFLFGQQKGVYPQISFEEALETIDHLLDRAPVCASVQRYIELFGRDRVLVLFHEDLETDPEEVVLRVEAFLGVAPFVPETVHERQNVTGVQRFPTVTGLLMRNRIRLKKHGLEWLVEAGKRTGIAAVFRWFQGQVRPYEQRPVVAPETEARLRAWFADDVSGLERLLGVDLSRWKPDADRNR